MWVSSPFNFIPNKIPLKYHKIIINIKLKVYDRKVEPGINLQEI